MKQHEFREPNVRCIKCASPRPQAVRRDQAHDHTKFACPKCDDVLVSRLTTASNEAMYPTHLWIPRGLMRAAETIPSARASRVDMYWTGREWSIAINGCHVRGHPELTAFAKHLESL